MRYNTNITFVGSSDSKSSVSTWKRSVQAPWVTLTTAKQYENSVYGLHEGSVSIGSTASQILS